MTQESVCSQGFVLYLVLPKRSGIPTGGGLRLVIVTLFGVTVSGILLQYISVLSLRVVIESQGISAQASLLLHTHAFFVQPLAQPMCQVHWCICTGGTSSHSCYGYTGS